MPFCQASNLPMAFVQCLAPSKSSGALYQKVTTTGSRSANGFRGELNNLAKPISAEKQTAFFIIKNLQNTRTLKQTTAHCYFSCSPHPTYLSLSELKGISQATEICGGTSPDLLFAQLCLCYRRIFQSCPKEAVYMHQNLL